MVPSPITRRTFLYWLTAPALAFVPRPVPPLELRAGLVYSDSDGNGRAALHVLKDDNKTTGIAYPA